MQSVKIDEKGRALEVSFDDPAPAGFIALELCDLHRMQAGAVWVKGLVLDPVEDPAPEELPPAVDPMQERAARIAALEVELAAALQVAASIQEQIEELQTAPAV